MKQIWMTPIIPEDHLSVHKSSKRPDWNTPQCVIDLVKEFAGPRGISLDPCSNSTSIVGAATELSLENEQDGLVTSWKPYAIVYVNPPYGRGITKWVKKAAHAKVEYDTETIMLIPARPDTKWFQAVWDTATAVCFWRGRIKFLGAEAGAPFPSALVYWGKNRHEFQKVFSSHGYVVVL